MVPPFPGREPETESTSVVLDAPEFPDFENLEVETAEGDAVDIGVLDLEALNLVCTRTPAPDQCEVTDFAASLRLCEPVEPLSSGDINASHFDLASLPEPMNAAEFPEPPVSELWSQSEDVSLDPQFNPHTDGAEKTAADDCAQPASDSHPRWVPQNGRRTLILDWQAD